MQRRWLLAALTVGVTGALLISTDAFSRPAAEEARAVAPGKAPEAKALNSKITAVTVYQGTALITREVTVPEASGTLEVVVSPLPPQTMQSSLYAEGIDGVRVLSTRYRTRALREDNREEVRQIANQIKQLQITAQRLQSEIKTAEENLKTVGKMEGFTAATLQHMTDKGTLNSEATIGLAKYVMTTRAEKMKEIVTLQQQVADGNEQMEFLKRQLQEKSAGSSKTERDAVLVVDKKQAGPAKVRLHYLVNAVNWHPQYKLKAGKDKDPVSLEYLAAIEQQTGEDWDNVKLVLSTAQPMLNAAPPELAALDVTVMAPGQQVAVGGRPGMQPAGPGTPNVASELKALENQSRALRSQSADNYNRLNPMDAAKQVNEAAALEQWGDLLKSKDEVLASRKDVRGVVANTWTNDGPSVTYHLPNKLSLPSRSDEQVLEVARVELMPDYFFKAVPVLTSQVYRLATLTNKSDMVLLPGNATMYQGSDFVGQTKLPLVAIGKQFTVGFGIDPQLQVSRVLMNKDRRTQGGNQVLKFDYRILVQSYKAEPVRVQVWDRLPHAEAQSLAVTLVSQKPDLSGDALYKRDERPKNLLRWDVVVEPSQNNEKALTIDYEYQLELDRTMHIGPFSSK